jgi:predicted Zn finger-like uncharacterized protein
VENLGTLRRLVPGGLVPTALVMLNCPSMIIACPACATRYAVPDSAIGIDGRTVRCAKCRHSWFQEGPQLARSPAAEAQPAPPPAPPPPAEPEPAPQAVAPPPAAGPAREQAPTAPAEMPAAPTEEASRAPVPPPPPPVEESAPERVYSDDEPDFADEPSSFAYEPPFKPRRNRAKLWMIAAILFALVTVGAIAAVAWYGLPSWAPLSRNTFAEARPDLVLDFPPGRQERRTLPNGAEFFGASGSITNIGKVRRSVPVLLIVLRDARDRIVYSWEVVPAKRQLAPGESVTVNEAITDVPKSARVAEIGWKPG